MSELQLRPHQTDVVEKVYQSFEDGHRCILLYAATGFGKTEVAMHFMREASRKYKRAAMVLDRIVLVNQTSTRQARYQINHGVMQGDHWRYRPMERIQICSAQTLEKRGNFPKPDPFDH
jgi:superfamily II DNA or RNA helicase